MERPDRTSPVPLYHQIAAALRREIESGVLPAGSSLEPIRDAARRLGVNLHTVRHAYAELAREGLVESRRARGTRVLPFRKPSSGTGRADAAPTASPPAFADEIRATCARLGLTPRELAAQLERWLAAGAATSPVVHVVECSPAQCEDLAAQLAARWDVDARPWPLERGAPPAEGTIVATFFHYNEIRTRWPERLHDVHFLTIAPDPALARRLAQAPSSDTVILCERDAPTLEAVRADLSVLLRDVRCTIVTREASDPGALLADDAGPTVLFPPRLWSELGEYERAHPRALHLRYVFDPDELEALGPRLVLHGEKR